MPRTAFAVSGSAAPLLGLKGFELSIIDRGDAARPATRLPVLDGGFDQIQLSVGISRRIVPDRSRGSHDVYDQVIRL